MTEPTKEQLEAFSKTPECIEAAHRDAGRWYFLTHYVDSIARNFAGWVCYYRREPSRIGPVLSSAGASIQEAVNGAMDDVEEFETTGCGVESRRPPGAFVANDCEHDAGKPPFDVLPLNWQGARDHWAAWCIKCHSWQEITNGPTANEEQKRLPK